MPASNEYLLGLLGKSDSPDRQPGFFADDQTSEIQAVWEAAEARRDSQGEATSEMTERRKSRSIGTTYERVKQSRKKQPAWQGLNPERSTVISQDPKLLNWQGQEEVPDTGGRREGKPNPMTQRRQNRSLYDWRDDQVEPQARADAPWADLYERQADGSLKLVSENSPGEPLVDPRQSRARSDALTKRRKGRSLPTIA